MFVHSSFCGSFSTGVPHSRPTQTTRSTCTRHSGSTAPLTVQPKLSSLRTARQTQELATLLAKAGAGRNGNSRWTELYFTCGRTNLEQWWTRATCCAQTAATWIGAANNYAVKGAWLDTLLCSLSLSVYEVELYCCRCVQNFFERLVQGGVCAKKFRPVFHLWLESLLFVLRFERAEACLSRCNSVTIRSAGARHHALK